MSPSSSSSCFVPSSLFHSQVLVLTDAFYVAHPSTVPALLVLPTTVPFYVIWRSATKTVSLHLQKEVVAGLAVTSGPGGVDVHGIRIGGFKISAGEGGTVNG